MDRTVSRPLILTAGLWFPAAHVLLGLVNLSVVASIGPTIAAMMVCLALILVVVAPSRSGTLGRVGTIAVVVGVLIIELLVVSVLPTNQHPGYAAWHCGAIQMLLVTLAFRNRIGAAWIGVTSFALIDFTGSTLRGLSLAESLALVLTPIVWVGIASVIFHVLRLCAEQIGRYQRMEQQSALLLAQDEARQIANQKWCADLDEAVRPALEKVAAGELDNDGRMACILLEARLRDEIRGRGLSTPEITQAAQQARLRGVKVDLIDDRGSDLPFAVLEETSRKVVKLMADASGGFVKVRALPEGSETAVSILAFDETSSDEDTYLEVADDRPASHKTATEHLGSL